MMSDASKVDQKANRQYFPLERKCAFAFLAICVFLVITYGNSLHGEWLFDDYPNIVENDNIHVKELSLHGAQQAVVFQGRVSRPLAYLSFALNHRIAGLDVFGYHAANLAIHFIAALFLFLFAFQTLRLPSAGGATAERAFAVALLAAVLWAVSPVQVLAVSYIVQRMTSLAGMFFIMAMFFYLKARTGAAPWRKGVSFSLFLVSALAAFASKENTAVLPVTLFFYDLYLLQGATRENVAKGLKWIVMPVTVVVILSVLYVDFPAVAFGFTQRDFTMAERVLTEGRVLILYLSLLVYPMGQRLTLLHDVEVSRSLMHPWTTLPAIFLIMILLAYALWAARKRPLLSFCIIAFFINHAIEGSVIPLELVYEHRNYIPSMFFFLAAASFLIPALDLYSSRRSLQYLIAVGVTCFIVVEGYTVHLRNGILRYEKTFWMDNVMKAPNLSRTHSNLGKAFLQEGNYAAALNEYGQALRLARYGNLTQPAFDLCCLGNFYLNVLDDAERAIACYEAAIDHYGVMPEIYDGLAVALLRKGDLKHAHENSATALSLREGKASLHSNFALILLKEGDLDGAVIEADKALALNSSYVPPLAVLGEVWRRRGDYRKSAWYWELYVKREGGDISAQMALMEVYAGLEDEQGTADAINRFLRLKGKRRGDEIVAYLNRMGNLSAYVPKEETMKAIMRRHGVDFCSTRMLGGGGFRKGIISQ